MKVRMKVWTLATMATLAAAGCEDTSSPPLTLSFDRPDDVDFVCLHVETSVTAGMPMTACDPDKDECAAGQDPIADGCRDPEARLHALVLQSTRGELGVIDLRRDVIVDVKPAVPGFSHHTVGARPVAVAASADGTEVYVASLGERSVLVLQSAGLREAAGQAPRTFALSGDPADMVVDAEGRLVIAMPVDRGVAVVDPVAGDEVGFVPLGAPVETGGGGGGPDGGGDLDAGPDAGELDGGADGGGGEGALDFPRPIGLALTPDRTAVWVADLGTDRVWQVDLAGLAVSASVDVGARTGDVAVSPDGGFVYAADAEQGLVRVISVAGEPTVVDPTQAPLDPLAVGPGIEVPGLARTTTFVERTDPLAVGEDAEPERLNGLFAFVASSNGSVYAVDLRDDDAPAEPIADVGYRPRAEEEDRYVFAPHHLRSNVLLTNDIGPQLDGPPVLLRAGDERDTSCGLVCLQPHFASVCGGGFCDDVGGGAVAEDGDPDVSGVRMLWEDPPDPPVDTLWRTTNEAWEIVFEGPLPETARARGNVERAGEAVDADHLLDDRADFCAFGVEPGDRLIFTSEPTPVSDATDCSAHELVDDVGPEFAVAEVTAERLTIEGGWPADLETCFPELLRYEVRAAGAWVVTGSVTGYLHPWTRGDDALGTCVLDETVHPLRRGRALTGEPFANPYLSFTLSEGIEAGGAERVPRRDDTYGFSTLGAFSPLRISSGGLIARVAAAPVGNDLFVVDESIGVIVFDLTDLLTDDPPDIFR